MFSLQPTAPHSDSTEDRWHDDYSGAPLNGSAWTEGEDAKRVVRGGSWDSYPGGLRSAVRFRDSSDDRGYVLGFRVGRTLSP